MATGIITKITEQSGNIKTGIIQADVEGNEIIFEKETIACGEGDPVSYTLLVVTGQPTKATDLKCLSGEVDHALTPLRTAHHGDVTIMQNQRLVVESGGSIKGDIVIDGGKMLVEPGGDVKGEITIMKSGSLLVSGSTKGNIDAQDVRLLQVSGGGDVKGEITILKGSQMVLDNGVVNGTVIVNDSCNIVMKSNSSISCTGSTMS